MTFKELIGRDVKTVFLNPAEFGEEHIVNGEKMLLIIDNNEQIERGKRQNQHMDGIFMNQKLMYVAASDFGSLPKQGSKLMLDGKLYIVADAISEGGIYSITVEANRGMGK